MRRFLQQLATNITRHPRHAPKINWSKGNWTSNIFRLHEYIWGRRYGIRAESTSGIQVINGKMYVTREFHSFEAFICNFEAVLRTQLSYLVNLFTLPELSFDLTPAYVTLGFFGFLFSFTLPVHLLPLVGLAIAHDADAVGTDTGTSPLTYNHTVTGTAPIIAIGAAAACAQSQATLGTVQYNSVSTSQAVHKSGTLYDEDTGVYLLANPSTGTHSVSVAFSASSGTNGLDCNAASTSYSGAQQSSTADATANTLVTTSTTGSQSVTITTVQNNCWVFSCCTVGYGSGTSATLSAGSTQRKSFTYDSATFANTASGLTQDTNGAVSAGNQTVSVTATLNVQNADVIITAASFAPNNDNISTPFDSSTVTDNLNQMLEFDMPQELTGDAFAGGNGWTTGLKLTNL